MGEKYSFASLSLGKVGKQKKKKIAIKRITLVNGRDHVMVNFMCQLDCATGCPAIWSNVTLFL
jgi:hypothetical protein